MLAAVGTFMFLVGRWQERWDSTQSLPQGLEVTLTLENLAPRTFSGEATTARSLP